MKKPIYGFAVLFGIICLASSAAGDEAPRCNLSQDAKDMAVRMTKVLLAELHVTDDADVLDFIRRLGREIVPPECRNGGGKNG